MVEVRENALIGSELGDLNSIDAKKKMTMSLLQVNGFETTYFRVNADEKKIFVVETIDREEFLARKFCLNRLFCSIELHLLINDGEEHWIIPVHLIE